ncbi:MAG: hypothetical protein CMM00_15515 [Rhodopirellula sp.]|uniref:hypothetical protein n=1 Tax=Rhodopirellula TaxID=265488 RepID=UPI000C4298CA|nr:hypothetical protein [Rhodopirellula sp. UBA1907]MAP10122.1 hypothetical protein [Rhodopirellula sp.]
MSQFVRRALVLATLAAVLGAPSLAQASHIRNIADRRQHPNGQFFVKSHSHHASVARPIARSIMSAWSR